MLVHNKPISKMASECNKARRIAVEPILPLPDPLLSVRAHTLNPLEENSSAAEACTGASLLLKVTLNSGRESQLIVVSVTN